MTILAGIFCKHCDQPAGRLMLTAMLQDAGASCSNDALLCWAREDGGEHDFEDRTRKATLPGEHLPTRTQQQFADPVCVIDEGVLS